MDKFITFNHLANDNSQVLQRFLGHEALTLYILPGHNKRHADPHVEDMEHFFVFDVAYVLDNVEYPGISHKSFALQRHSRQAGYGGILS